jgi:hypothetical protein
MERRFLQRSAEPAQGVRLEIGDLRAGVELDGLADLVVEPTDQVRAALQVMIDC